MTRSAATSGKTVSDVEVTFTPDPAVIVPGGTVEVAVTAVFLDPAGNPLPDEYDWYMALPPGNQPGLTADGRRILVADNARTGRTELFFQASPLVKKSVWLEIRRP